jgi:ABC-type transport system involved in multi-copper enzyme maturation permease subunit
MMMLEFFRFELKQQLRTPLLWVVAGLFGLFAFAATSSDAVVIGSAIGNVDRNAPTVIATMLGFFTILGLFVAAIYVAGALLRDFELGTADLFFSTPMRKRDFLIGRFLAAVTAGSVVYLAVAVGLMLAPMMPWIDPDRLGPFSLQPYLWGFAVLVLPNLLFTSALLTLLAVTLRSMLAIYLGVIAFFVLYQVTGTMSVDLDNTWIATLTDPFGMRAFMRTIRYWSADERNAGLPAMTGYLLANRALWTTVAIAMVAAAFALFRQERSGTRRAWWRRGKAAAAPAAPSPAAANAATTPAPRMTPRFGTSTAWSQLRHQLTFDGAAVLTGVPFLVMLMFGLFNLIGGLLFADSLFGTPIHPVTSVMIGVIQDNFTWLLVIIVMFYAGELVWKERGAGLGEVVDAMPAPDWVPLAAKFLVIVAVSAVFLACGSLVAMAFQALNGDVPLQPLLYAKAAALNLGNFVLLGGLALVLQVYTNNKFAGYAAMIGVLVLQGLMSYWDFTQNLYRYGGTPDTPYSDMNGYGHYVAGQLWFTGYWSLALLALLLLAAALWVRGVAPRGRERLRLARQRLGGPLGTALAASVAAFVGVGAWLFWNTHVRNEYTAPDALQDLQVRYEKEYRRYLDLPQPRIVAVHNDVDLRPEDVAVTVTGRWRIRNTHAEPIPALHVQNAPDVALDAIDVGPATLEKDDEAVGYRIYRFATPMQPGEEREITFTVSYARDGITNDAGQTQILGNGTFFNSSMLPSFGFNENYQVADRNERRKLGLPELPRMAKLEDEAARANTYISDDADWIDYSSTVCTAPGQIALAPGYLQREEVRGGRRCFDYAMDRPMLPFYAYLSADWTVTRDEYEGIPIEVYHLPEHAWNVGRMIDATKKSLAYYQQNFTPYQHRQVRIVEFPDYAGRFAQSFANTIPFSEGIGFVTDLSDPDETDYVFYVTAHEVAHQWWAHQVIGAAVQGGTVLTESLSQYSALMVMEKEYGRERMRRFLKYELDRYLSGRGGETREELPLYRVEGQQYIHYQKGSLVFYRLREEMGEDALNRALRKFLRDKGFEQPPYTTSAELLDYIRAEATPEQQALITDLFERIVFYDNRVEEATARKLDDGRYEVTLDLRAGKRVADGEGKESPATMDDWIEVGVFARGASGEEKDERALYLQRHRITEDEPSLTVIVDELPFEAGFDPYNKLIDRVSSDNRRKVVMR